MRNYACLSISLCVCVCVCMCVRYIFKDRKDVRTGYSGNKKIKSLVENSLRKQMVN